MLNSPGVIALKKLALIVESIDFPGGGKRVALAFAKTLKKHYTIDLYTFRKINWDLIKKITPAFYIKPDNEFIISKFFGELDLKLPLFFAYKLLIKNWKISRMKLRDKYDLIINANGDMLMFPGDIIYIFYTTLFLDKEIEKYRRFPWNLYIKPYSLIRDKMFKEYKKSIRHSRIVTLSKYSQSLIQKHFGMSSIIIYPPIDLRQIEEAVKNDSCSEKEKQVISIGRFSPEKELETALYVAKHMPDVRFVLAGGIYSRKSRNYYKKLIRIKKKLGLDNVKFLTNITDSEKINLLKQSSVYLSTRKNEHFGISIVEAMAAYNIPVVYKDGGQWSDIVEYGKYGYGFQNYEEAANAIYEALERDCSYRKIIAESTKRFSFEKFSQDVYDLINSLK